MMRFVAFNKSFLLTLIPTFCSLIPISCSLILTSSFLLDSKNILAQVPASEPDAGDGSRSDAGSAKPAAHGWQEAEGGRIQSLMGVTALIRVVGYM